MVACRSAPLSLSLFGEDSATSFADEPPAALEIGPLWSPAWLAPSSPSSSPQTQHAQQLQHDQHAQQPQHAQWASDGQHQQQSNHSPPAAIPDVLPSQQVLPDTEGDSDFGSFTGNQPSLWLPSLQVESAQDYTAKADQQTPALFQSVISSTASNGAEMSGAADGPPVRPAAAAATAAILHSMDRSAPISLGLFGEESYDDPVLELPAPAAIQGAATDLQQGALASSPRQTPPACITCEATDFEQAASGQQSQTPHYEIKPRYAFPSQFKFQAEHDFEPSWQHAHKSDPPVNSSLIFTPDATDDDFSPSWLQAGKNKDFGAKWQNTETASEGPSTTATAFQSPHAFAATWPPLITDADSASHQHLPGRQALSGPNSLELFGMKEQEDQPPELPTDALVNTPSAPQSPLAAVDDEQQQMEDIVHPQQPAAAWQSENTQQSVLGRQSSPGPISLELFGMEETQDAPLEPPVQALITVLPKAALDTSALTSWSLPTGSFSQSKQANLDMCMSFCTCLYLLDHAKSLV